MPTGKPQTIQPASTVVLVREAEGGLEVFLTQRQKHLAFLPGVHVFPGGRVDEADAAPASLARAAGLAREEAARLLEMAEDWALAHWVAGVREVFEEAGILLVRDEEGRPAPAERLRRLRERRAALHAGERSFARLLAEAGLHADAGALRYIDHWITPEGPPRRFNTRFFVARAPADQTPEPWEPEIASALWLRPEDALGRWRAGEIMLIPPTVAVLSTLERHGAFDALVEAVAREGAGTGNVRL